MFRGFYFEFRFLRGFVSSFSVLLHLFKYRELNWIIIIRHKIFADWMILYKKSAMEICFTQLIRIAIRCSSWPSPVTSRCFHRRKMIEWRWRRRRSEATNIISMRCSCFRENPIGNWEWGDFLFCESCTLMILHLNPFWLIRKPVYKTLFISKFKRGNRKKDKHRNQIQIWLYTYNDEIY